MLAQFVDVFDESTRIVIYVAGMGAPFVAFIVSSFRRGGIDDADLGFCLFYYLIAGLAWRTLSDTTASGLFLLLVLLFGPLIAINLLLRCRRKLQGCESSRISCGHRWGRQRQPVGVRLRPPSVSQEVGGV